ncbi:TRAP transporter small permease [Pararhizobium haloflavum]|uniref:TRAP transporter small permease n=1 Tax=Pararhizobium haloflavum TaxID=2037914 RepID=UPI000C193AF3|nr:TRAP transporter small permease [Pararhizobium haloflavum]
MSTEAEAQDHPAGLARRIIEYWAIAGGLVLFAVVFINAFSLVSLIFAGSPFPGDFEIVEVGVAITVFAFLPYCQLTGSNVTADIFTAGAGPRVLQVLAVLASLAATGFAAFLLWRMYGGFLDMRTYRETTAIYQFPLWIAYIPILISLVLYVIAAAITLVDALKGRVSESGELL